MLWFQIGLKVTDQLNMYLEPVKYEYKHLKSDSYKIRCFILNILCTYYDERSHICVLCQHTDIAYYVNLWFTFVVVCEARRIGDKCHQSEDICHGEVFTDY